MDLIERQDALDTLEKIGWIETKADKEYAIQLFTDLPSAQPERKKGKWVDNTYCSECGWVHETDPGFIGSVDGFNFCPRCGADMRGEADEAD